MGNNDNSKGMIFDSNSMTYQVNVTDKNNIKESIFPHLCIVFIGLIILMFYIIQSLSTGIYPISISAIVSTIAWLLIIVGLVQHQQQQARFKIERLKTKLHGFEAKIELMKKDLRENIENIYFAMINEEGKSLERIIKEDEQIIKCFEWIKSILNVFGKSTSPNTTDVSPTSPVDGREKKIAWEWSYYSR